MDALSMIGVALALAGLWSLFCRFTGMLAGRTRPTVILQHAFLALGLFIAGTTVVVPWAELRLYGAQGWVVDLLAMPHFGTVVAIAAIVQFLLMGAPRWRHGAPEGTDLQRDDRGPADRIHKGIVRGVR